MKGPIAIIMDKLGNFLTTKDEGSGICSLDANIRSGKINIKDNSNDYYLAVDSNGNISVVTVVSGSPIDPRQIRTLTASDIVSAVQSGTWDINNISGVISLPTGASTSAKQDLIIAELQDIEADVESGNTKLDTVNTNLGTIETDIESGNTKLDSAISELQDIEADVESVDTHIQSVQPRRIQDGSSSNLVKIDSSGNLYTVSPAPEAPAGKTSVSDTQQSSVSGTTDHFYIIPTGEYLTIQRLKAGSEMDTVAGSKIEMYYAPNGNTTGMTLLEALYVNGSSDFYDLNYITSAGDGTKAILLRRERLGGGGCEIFAKWEGYY